MAAAPNPVCPLNGRPASFRGLFHAQVQGRFPLVDPLPELLAEWDTDGTAAAVAVATDTVTLPTQQAAMTAARKDPAARVMTLRLILG